SFPVALTHHGYPLIFASYEGLSEYFEEVDGQWHRINGFKIEGNQEHPTGSRGCSEIKVGRFQHKDSEEPSGFCATIEPWHGNQVVVYTSSKGKTESTRHVIDTELKWGHALWCCDLDGDGN